MGSRHDHLQKTVTFLLLADCSRRKLSARQSAPGERGSLAPTVCAELNFANNPTSVGVKSSPFETERTKALWSVKDPAKPGSDKGHGAPFLSHFPQHSCHCDAQVFSWPQFHCLWCYEEIHLSFGHGAGFESQTRHFRSEAHVRHGCRQCPLTEGTRPKAGPCGHLLPRREAPGDGASEPSWPRAFPAHRSV